MRWTLSDCQIETAQHRQDQNDFENKHFSTRQEPEALSWIAE